MNFQSKLILAAKNGNEGAFNIIVKHKYLAGVINSAVDRAFVHWNESNKYLTKNMVHAFAYEVIWNKLTGKDSKRGENKTYEINGQDDEFKRLAAWLCAGDTLKKEIVKLIHDEVKHSNINHQEKYKLKESIRQWNKRKPNNKKEFNYRDILSVEVLVKNEKI